MNQTQRKSTAKFLYDIAKILVAIAVISRIFSMEHIQMVSLSFGVTVTVIFFLLGYYVERKVEND